MRLGSNQSRCLQTPCHAPQITEELLCHSHKPGINIIIGVTVFMNIGVSVIL